MTRYWALLAMLTCAVKAQGAEPLYVGVLEVVDQQDLHTREFHPFAQVRFAFRKDDQGWSPAGFAEPERMTWHLALDGREVGMVETRADTHSSEGGYTRYAQPITEPAKAPRIPVAEGRFWYHPWKVTVRPLLALSAPNAKDPDGWKPAQLGAVELQRLRAEFRKVVRGRRQCDQPETPPIRVARYADSEIHLIAAYRARDGRVVAGEELTASKADCGFFDDEFSYSYWFLMQADGAATLMGSQMQPLEAADVDGDGVSEWLFHMSSGEQHDGYVLFHDRLTQKTEMGWGYH